MKTKLTRIVLIALAFSCCAFTSCSKSAPDDIILGKWHFVYMQREYGYTISENEYVHDKTIEDDGYDEYLVFSMYDVVYTGNGKRTGYTYISEGKRLVFDERIFEGGSQFDVDYISKKDMQLSLVAYESPTFSGALPTTKYTFRFEKTK